METGPRWDGRRVNGLDDVTLLHTAIPEITMDSVRSDVKFLGKRLAAPLLISSMTGGHSETKEINKNLAIAASEHGIGIGVGSQRAALEDDSLMDTYSVVREYAPNAFVYGNIGAPQLKEHGVDAIIRASEMIDADAVAIHLNFLQEAVQPEGDTDATGVINMIEEACASDIPIIVKETGAGMRREDAIRLKEAGVSAIDVAGVGGTSWARVEGYRSTRMLQEIGEEFWKWGIPTAVGVVECSVGVPLIASGGVRSGLDCARCISLGADVCATALPALKAVMKKDGVEAVGNLIRRFVHQLKIAMFLTGSTHVQELRNVPLVIDGFTRDYLLERGFSTQLFARRGRIKSID